MDCNCKSSDLFNRGCRCGAFEFEKANHVWFNGIIYSIAKNATEAESLSKEYLTEFEDFEPEWITGDGWQIIPDDKQLPLLITDDSDKEETRLAHEWVEYYGPGFLAAI
jgi:hypothetical protein